MILSIIGDVLPRLNNQLVDKKEICLTPAYSDSTTKSYDDVVAEMKPLISMLVSQIASYDQQNTFISHYANTNNVGLIASDVERGMSTLRSSMPQVDELVNQFMSFTCNG